MNSFVEGSIIGFSIAMAVGPISLLCIRNSLIHGFASGFTTGLGAALADGFYGVVAGLGLSAVSSLIIGGGPFLRLAGGLFLCYLGISMALKKKSAPKAVPKNKGSLTTLCTTFLLTLANPMTIVSFIGIYAGLGIGYERRELASVMLFALGIFFGSSIWYAILSRIASLLKHKLSESASFFLNLISGCIITGFGIFSLASVVY